MSEYEQRELAAFRQARTRFVNGTPEEFIGDVDDLLLKEHDLQSRLTALQARYDRLREAVERLDSEAIDQNGAVRRWCQVCGWHDGEHYDATCPLRAALADEASGATGGQAVD